MLIIDEILTRGVTNITVKEHLESRLKKGEKLRVKLGIDPTGSDVHIGHGVPLWKLRNFQDLGHQIVLIIGDFTSQIGDASDKTAERQMLNREQIEMYMKDYEKKISRILDMSKVELHYNSEWLAKLDFNDVATLAKEFSVAQMLDRENFSKRYTEGKRIGLQEFLYPLMQGYDSVAIRADLEVGGNDQYFNLMAGRVLQKAFEQEPQDVMTFELLPGLDGRKMSKTYGNTINIDDEPREQFGKIMSIPDDFIIKYFIGFTQLPSNEIQEIEAQLKKGQNPRDAKMRLGYEIVKLYNGEKAAQEAQEAFIQQFSEGNKPEDIPEFVSPENESDLAELLVKAGLESSKGNARRMIEQGAVKIDDQKVNSIVTIKIKLKPGMIIQVGKRKFIKIVLK